MGLIRLFRKKGGFTFLELIMGMSIFLIGISFFTVMFRFSSNNKVIARELTAMSTAAQNMAEVYMASAGTQEVAVSDAIEEGISEGFAAGYIDFPTPEQICIIKQDYRYYIYKITVTIHPRIDKPGIDDYVFSFYYID